MQKRRILLMVLAVGVLVLYRQINPIKTLILQHVTGTTMGTIPYSIKYIAAQEDDYKKEIDSILVALNQSLSTYIPDSEISRFNQNDTIIFESGFMHPVLQMSKEIFENSGGAYDPTIGPLIDAWGFGPKKKSSLDSTIVDSLLQVVGFEQVTFDESSAHKPAHTSLSFSASAKGYALDVIADFLKSQNIDHYMIEIGGEVRCQGQNQNQTVWKIGIETPEMSQTVGHPFATVFVKNRSLATSGNYRNYYKENDRIISHTISPFTGYPISHHLLSASIFANNCTIADGYATACMVLGLEESIRMIEKLNGVDAFFIYSETDGTLKSYATAGIRSQIEILP
ncbi:FAD:protein FMN transferase [Reichenbachiella carrageenanivorans]|uniref:FAD:protein FMN transferase n=1 Tax=Reichenbachiella carrageenanivorans TaxID=2979869 RepID=A0ABY6D306_9BACT|nr:FAD:protein FMN transferase [Reichenbachiella carrageenanivorans]UXX80545.1 FAD:protein FMN transferase [Reichenbachiella carrageenanivorans]